ALRQDREVSMIGSSRVCPDPQIKRARLNRPAMRLGTPEAKLMRVERERHGLLLTWLQANALKALELTHGARRAAGPLMRIKLYDLIAGGCARVLYFYRDG